MSHVQYRRQQLRESYVYECVVYSTEWHRTCDMYRRSSRRSSCDGAAHELSRCYNTYGMYHVRYPQQQLLRSHLCTQLRCGPSPVSVFRFPLRGRDHRRSESYVFCSSTCDMYSSGSCDGATHVLLTLLRTVCPTYIIYYRAAQRELHIRVCSLQHRTAQNV